MGVRASVVVCVTSFLLGSLFTHWIADSLTLWKSPVTDEHLWTAALYYSILTKGPVQILYFLSAVVVLGGTTIFWSFRDGEAGNLMFDGGSIFLYSTTVIMYMFSVIPNLFDKFSSVPLHQAKDVFPRALRSPTLELASNHLICSVALTGVLILQAGRWWAELSDGDDEGYLEEKLTEDSEPSEVQSPAAATATVALLPDQQ
ncbi:hypothetical protein PAXINDRAFT_175965 [Paxillus involutus ATCC 200175]|nr:hypothetical protein PAXINDRAFT_175965 [Paxillus involutus ATCC 200175]